MGTIGAPEPSTGHPMTQRAVGLQPEALSRRPEGPEESQYRAASASQFRTFGPDYLPFHLRPSSWLQGHWVGPIVFPACLWRRQSPASRRREQIVV